MNVNFETPEQCQYVIDMLDRRRDLIQSDINELERIFKDHTHLHKCVNYTRRVAEHDMNATLTVRVMMAKIELDRKPQHV